MSNGWKKHALLLGTSYIVIELADPSSGTGYLALNFTLQKRMHLSAFEMAQFIAVSGFAWYLKPIAGILSDNFPLFGTRRRGYLIIASFVASVLWLLLGTIPTAYYPFLAITIGLNAMLVLMSTVTGGFLVEAGQQESATGRLSSNRSMAENLVALTAGPVAGLLGTLLFGVASGIVAILLFSLTILLYRLMREKSDAQFNRQTWRRTLTLTKACFCNRQMWIAAGILCLLYFAPAFETALFYYQTQTLKFSSQLIGNLFALSAAFSLVAPLVYVYMCRRLQLRHSLVFATCLNVIGILLLLAYRSRAAAMWISSANGLLGALATLTVYDLLARATPKSSEAFGYSVMFSVANIVSSASDIWGSWLWDQSHNFATLVWLNAGTTAMVLVVIPFLPARLLDWSDDRKSSEVLDRDTTPARLFS
jgi:Na+/melibiose symporter-like transporter